MVQGLRALSHWRASRLFIQPLRSPEFGEHGLPFLTLPHTLSCYMKSTGRKDCSLDLPLYLVIWFYNIFIYYLRILYMYTMCFDHTHLPRLPPILPDRPPTILFQSYGFFFFFYLFLLFFMTCWVQLALLICTLGHRYSTLPQPPSTANTRSAENLINWLFFFMLMMMPLDSRV